MNKLFFGGLVWLVPGLVFLYPHVGLTGCLGVAFIAMAYRDSHEHFKHGEEDDG